MSTRFLANFQTITDTDSSAYYDSDHSTVTISLTTEDQGVPRGPGAIAQN